jgi:hypothetical protein
MSTLVINGGPGNDCAEVLPELTDGMVVFTRTPPPGPERCARYEQMADREAVPPTEPAALRMAANRTRLGTFRDLLESAAEHGHPVVVKPVIQGDSRDVTVLRSENGLTAFGTRIRRDGPEVLPGAGSGELMDRLYGFEDWLQRHSVPGAPELTP